MMSIAKVFLILSLIISPFSAEGVISKKILEEIKNNLFPDLETGVSESQIGTDNYSNISVEKYSPPVNIFLAMPVAPTTCLTYAE